MPFLPWALRPKCLIQSSHVSLANPPTNKSRWSSANCMLTSCKYPVCEDAAKDTLAFFKIQPSTWLTTGRPSTFHKLNLQPTQSPQPASLQLNARNCVPPMPPHARHGTHTRWSSPSHRTNSWWQPTMSTMLFLTTPRKFSTPSISAPLS